MTLIELAAVYKDESDKLAIIIQRTRKKLKTEKGNELLRTRRTLVTLYDMSRDLRQTAGILEHYYDKGVDNNQLQ